MPFGELGAVQNMSRDWVIDKITVGVPYDTDLEKVRKLVKKIGQQLMDDPELGQHILEPLKMQGVEQMGDYAIQIRLKIMTSPGEQFVIRRKAYALLKKAFEDNDIRFAFPTVRVSGGEKGELGGRRSADRHRASQAADDGGAVTAKARQGLDLEGLVRLGAVRFPARLSTDRPSRAEPSTARPAQSQPDRASRHRRGTPLAPRRGCRTCARPDRP